ncbi:MAG: hypothetical protein O2894_12400 [Planctomycetota bacterium]|nr:hypothetical protein [Planctomycetota bacterium]
MRVRLLVLALALSALAAAPTSAEDGTEVVETEHYRLHYQGTRRDAEEAGRVLEAAWTGFGAWFGVRPVLKGSERLTVRFYATADAWAAGIRADGTHPPKEAGGYYWPGTRTAYLFRQPTSYFTRTLLIHEAAHQYHFLTRAQNRNPRAAWYTEGLAEYLSWHRWDGERLELAVVPGVSLKDYPAKALAELDDPAFDLGAVVSGGASASRPISWALFRFLATGDEGKPLPRFDAFCAKMDRGGEAPPLFRSYFGRPDRLQPKLRAWLAGQQTAWAAVFNEWEQVGIDSFRGYASVVTACRLKAPASRITARLDPAGDRRWRAGLLLHWSSNEDYTVAIVSSWGHVRVDRRQKGVWVPLGRTRVALPPGDVLFDALRDGEQVRLRVGGEDVGAYTLPGGILGLCLEGSDLCFEGVRWE